MPWWAYLVIEIVKLLPSIFKAVKTDPSPSNKESTKVVVSRIKKATVGEATDLKGL